MHGYLSADIIRYQMLTAFRERRSRKSVSFEELPMSADKYPCIFSRQMEGSGYIPHTQVNSAFRARWLAGSEVISKHNHQQPSAKSQGFPKSF